MPILWDVSLDQFDRRKTGYPLEGGHARVECRRCHNPEHIAPAARKTIRVRDLRRTFLGLQRECASCHQDEHGGQLGANCERCHAVAKWKDVTRFDHGAAKFHLAGAHERVACAKCHKAEPVSGRDRPRVRYTGIAFARCQDCHQDPHKGSFQASCNSCHIESVWKTVNSSTSVFDHSRTKYPLLGKHVAVPCERCHRSADFKAPVAHQLCQDCHQDAHSGQFLARADKGECAGCHNVAGWKPSTFTVQQHARTEYALLGRHATVACSGCHKPAGRETLFRVKHEQCLECHKDVHESQFAGLPYKNRCEECHTVERFAPARFTLARHDKTRFPLAGAHAAVSCNECHKALADRRGAVPFHFADIACTGCHADPHQGQFARRIQTVLGGRKAGCEACHSVRSWNDVPAFDHATTRFELTGAHKGVPCAQCHRSSPVSVGLRRVVYRDTPLLCRQCHEDVHAGQFQTVTGDAQDCAQCDETGRWRPARFDHDRAGFRLAGAHAEVPCAGCHNTRREVAGRQVMFYKPTPKECSGCHARNITN